MTGIIVLLWHEYRKDLQYLGALLGASIVGTIVGYIAAQRRK